MVALLNVAWVLNTRQVEEVSIFDMRNRTVGLTFKGPQGGGGGWGGGNGGFFGRGYGGGNPDCNIPPAAGGGGPGFLLVVTSPAPISQIDFDIFV